MAGFKLSERAARATAKVVSDALRTTASTPGRRSSPSSRPGQRYWGHLTAALDAPSNGQTHPTVGYVQVWRPDPASTADPVAMIDDTDIGVIDVVNRDPSLEGSEGAVCKIEFLNGEWSFYWVGCLD